MTPNKYAVCVFVAAMMTAVFLVGMLTADLSRHVAGEWTFRLAVASLHFGGWVLIALAHERRKR